MANKQEVNLLYRSRESNCMVEATPKQVRDCLTVSQWLFIVVVFLSLFDRDGTVTDFVHLLPVAY